MRWDSPGMRNTKRVNDSFYVAPPVNADSSRLVEDCKGCQQIVDNKCRLYKCPKKVKRPCSMKKV